MQLLRGPLELRRGKELPPGILLCIGTLEVRHVVSKIALAPACHGTRSLRLEEVWLSKILHFEVFPALVAVSERPVRPQGGATAGGRLL